jgi:hypothetical protein
MPYALSRGTLPAIRDERICFGSRELALKIAVWAFDQSGKPLQFMHEDFKAKLTDKQYTAVQAQHGFPHTVVITPPPGTAEVRLLVKDVATGRMGSVNLPCAKVAAAVTPPAAGVGTAAQTPH